MKPRSAQPQSELTSLVISPNRELAQQFSATLPTTRAFHVLAEMKSYPPVQTLDIRLRQLRPDLVFLDLASDLDQAAELIEFIAGIRPPVFVVGLHFLNDSEAILRSLRAGATEFLYAPFDLEMQRQAIARIIRLRKPSTRSEAERGRLVVFSSSKPGSGASTLACQTAFALGQSGKRILLADFDMTSGSVAFFLKIGQEFSVLDALKAMEDSGQPDWSSLVVNAQGIDVLAAPETPSSIALDPDRLHDALESVRELYDWIIVDLPSIFEKAQFADDVRLRRGLPGLHVGAAQPAHDAQGGGLSGSRRIRHGALPCAGEPVGKAGGHYQRGHGEDFRSAGARHVPERLSFDSQRIDFRGAAGPEVPTRQDGGHAPASLPPRGLAEKKGTAHLN